MPYILNGVLLSWGEVLLAIGGEGEAEPEAEPEAQAELGRDRLDVAGDVDFTGVLKSRHADQSIQWGSV
jgi:hypothetical protein